MASTDTESAPGLASIGPVLFAYDGSELAQLAIEQAARQLVPGREALVVCLWRPADVGFVPVGESNFNADHACEVCRAAEETAAHGAALAKNAGFDARSIAIEGAPTWKSIVEVAQQRGASLIVLGSHRRSGLAGHLLGSVAGVVVAHSDFPVLVVHQRS